MNSLANGLIAQISGPDQTLFRHHARLVEMKAGDVLLPPFQDHPNAYFITQGSVALFVQARSKTSLAGLAVGLVGREGAVGLQTLWGLGSGNMTALVQSPGFAWVMTPESLRRLIQKRAYWLPIWAQSLWHLYQDVADLAVLSHIPNMALRLADWLLRSEERCQPEPLCMTHAHMARMLGVRRASVTLAAQTLQQNGWIHYSRGRIDILNRPALSNYLQTTLKA